MMDVIVSSSVMGLVDVLVTMGGSVAALVPAPGHSGVPGPTSAAWAGAGRRGRLAAGAGRR
ncbi:MAG: hypothetical protein ACYDB6_09060, partial [Candidatus Limnocylindrales bacterium]